MSTATTTTLQLVEGYVWCDKHGEVHADTLNPYGYIEGQDLCVRDDHRQLFMEPDAVIDIPMTTLVLDPSASKPARGRLTKHQREVYKSIESMSRRRLRGDPHTWVDAQYVGSKNACDRLVEKGWIEMDVDYGPRGGELRKYRPIIEEGQ